MVDVSQVSFSKGEVSPLSADRTDLAFYSSALQTCVNFFVRREGSVSNRPGLQYIANCLSNTPNGSYLLPFVYNNQQSYVTDFAAGAIAVYEDGAPANLTSYTILTVVLTGDGELAVTTTAPNSVTVGQQVILSGVSYTGSLNPNRVTTVNSILTSDTFFAAGGQGTMSYVSGGSVGVQTQLSNPYLYTDLPNLRWAQSADVMNVVVASNPMYQLKRLTATSFSYTEPTLLFGPFQDTNTDGTATVYASAVQGTVTLISSPGIFKPEHVGTLFYIQEQFLGSIQPWTAAQLWANGGSSCIGAMCRSDGKIYRAVGPPGDGNTLSGNFQPVHTFGTQWDGNQATVAGLGGSYEGIEWQFVSTDAGVAQITHYTSATQVTAVVQSYKGVPSSFPPTTVGGPVSVHGPYSFTGDGSTTAFGSLTASTTVDPNQFYVTVAGVFQDPGTYSISAVAGNIVFTTAPANGTAILVNQVVGTINNIYLTNGVSSAPTPMTGLCVSTYWAFGSLSDIQGYASEVCYYNDRLVLAGTQLQPQTFFTSRVSNYLDFGVSSPQVDSDAITETINSRQQNPINNLLPLNNLLLGTASSSYRATDSSGLGAITPSNISVLPQEFYGMQAVPAVQTGTTILYVQWGGRKIRDILYQFYNDKFMGKELTIFAQQVFPYGTTCTRMAFSPEPYGLVFCVRSDGVLCVCAYLPEQEVVAWSRYITAGNFEDVCVIPENGTFAVYVIVGRTINNVYVRYIERFAAREFTDIDDAFFVDSGLTYDGRNTSSTTMVLTGGGNWESQSAVTVIASSMNGWANFQSEDVGNQVWLYDGSGNESRVQLTSITSGQIAQAIILNIVPPSLQGITAATWTFAKANLIGLNNLVNQTCAVFADGATQPAVTIANDGSCTLTSPAGVAHVGLPYTYQLEGMNLNIQGQGTIRNVSKSIPRVSVVVDESFPFSVGQDFGSSLRPAAQRQNENWGDALAPFTGVSHVEVAAYNDDDATVCIQGTDPVPVTITGWVAEVEVGE